SIKRFRERIRLRGSVYDLKPEIRTEMGSLKTELNQTAELARQNALASAKEIEGLSTEQFVDRLEKGDGGILDQSRVPPEQRPPFRDLLKTPEGRAGIENYKAQLVNALKVDVVREIDRLTNEYGSRIDEFLKEVEDAKTHEDLNAALNRAEGAF